MASEPSADGNEALCEHCKPVIHDLVHKDCSNPKWQLQNHRHVIDYFSFLQLATRKQNGQACRLCDLIAGIIEHRRKQEPGEGEETNIGVDVPAAINVEAEDSGRFTVAFRDRRESSGQHVPSFDVELFEPGCTSHEMLMRADDDSQVMSINRCEVNKAVDTDDTFKTLSLWVSKCNTEHEACSRIHPRPLPMRVIEVGSEDGSIPKLVEGEGLYAPYVTLSHCWGEDSQGLLFTHNIGKHKLGIDLSSLPKTFRDAVIITRKLGLRYLWIDSLCIVQDSPRDWKSNCPMMAAIYTNSQVTIAATAAKDSNEGIFADRQENEEGTDQMSLILSPEEVPDLHLSKSLGIRLASSKLSTALSQSHLDTRGWILQERFLSPAVLYFCRDEIFWECRTCIASETQPRPVTHDVGYMRNFTTSRSALEHERGHFTSWYMLVEQYTSKDLTYPADRQAAILGLAKAFRNMYWTTFAMGLWMQDIQAGLLWSVFSPGPRTKPGRPWPSWSWLSVPRQINYCRVDQHVAYPVRTASSAQDMEPHGYTKVRVRRRTERRLQTWANLVRCKYVKSEKPEAEGPRRLPALWSGRLFHRKRTKHHVLGFRVDGVNLLCLMDVENDRGHGRTYCMRVASWEDTEGQTLAYYLVLRRKAGKRRLRHARDMGSFLRVGIGLAEPGDVDKFFEKSKRCFITLV